MARDVWSDPAWPLTLEAWGAPAQAARAVAEPTARLVREVAALRATLADLADLGMPWLIAEPDPLGTPIDAGRQPATQQEDPARALSPERRRRFASAGSDRAKGQQGPEKAPSPVRSRAREGDEPLWQNLAREEAPSPLFADRSGRAPTEGSTTAIARSMGRWETGSATRRQATDVDDAMLIAAALRPIGGASAPGDLLERWAGLAPEVEPPEVAPTAQSLSRRRQGGSDNPVRERTLPRSGEDLTGQLLAAARGEASPTMDPALPRDRTREVPIPAPARFQEEGAASDSTPAAAAEGSSAQAVEGEPAPQAADLLTSLTTRWWEARKGGGVVLPTRSVTSAAALTEEPDAQGQAYASRSLERAALFSAPAGVERTSLQDALAQRTAPAVQNTIHLTVQPPPGAGAFDADELAELLDRVLRREAQRHGIPLL